jgi:hypothetical protein
MCSAVLNHKFLFSLLYPDYPSFLLTSHVFGCVDFVHAIDPDRDKLCTRDRKFVFLGYSCTQKGICCYNPESRKYFVSVDVTFFESMAILSSPS